MGACLYLLFSLLVRTSEGRCDGVSLVGDTSYGGFYHLQEHALNGRPVYLDWSETR